ncbi:MAG: Fe-S cluster assembly protein SufD [Pseudomonadota bacterium]
MSRSLLINPTALEAGLEAEFVARIRASDEQRGAFMKFVETGLPHRRMEGWRWSDFRAAARDASPGANAAPNPFDGVEAITVRLTDSGWEFSEGTDGLSLSTAKSAPPSGPIADHPIVALNAAFSDQRLRLEIEKGVVIQAPILILDERGATSSFAQVEIAVGPGARVTVLHALTGPASFRAATLDFKIEAGAAAQYFILSPRSEGVSHLTAHATLGEKAAFKAVGLSTGGRLARIEVHVTYDGPDAEAVINSAALLADETHADFTTLVRHNAPGCVTRQIHKGVARDKGRAVFQGKFHVNRIAQKTDAQMTANALLLSDNAEANHKPELEIYADDVECAHGSTAGSLDDEALFYMRQRGLSDEAARALLIEAFVGEVFDAIDDVHLASVFRRAVSAWLEVAQ